MKKNLMIAMLATTIIGSALAADYSDMTILNKWIGGEEAPDFVAVKITPDTSWVNMFDTLAKELKTTKGQIIFIATKKMRPGDPLAMTKSYTLDEPADNWDEIRKNPEDFFLAFKIRPPRIKTINVSTYIETIDALEALARQLDRTDAAAASTLRTKIAILRSLLK